jgi:hypothetical protein
MTYLRLIAIGSAVAFLIGTISLHFLQPGYDPVNQLMSELALGPYGIIMLFAFIALASSISTLAFVIWRLCGNITLHVVLLIGAACFAGAGILPIDVFNGAHIILVFCAFVMCGLGMYLLPGCLNSSSKAHDRMISWGLGGMLVFTVIVGQVSLPGGIAQRLEAAILLMWVVVFAWRTTR